MSLALTIAIVWIAASVVVAVGWMLLAVYLRRHRRAEEHAVRQWLPRMRLSRPHLPRQRSGDSDEHRHDHGDPAA